MFDGEAFGDQMAELVRNYVKAQLEPLRDRIDALEKRAGEIEKSGSRFRGVYQRANSYKRGDQSTHKGSLWTALMDVPEGIVPGENSGFWQLSAKGVG